MLNEPQRNECWVRFSVNDWFKPDNGPNEVWVGININHRNKTFEDFDQLRYCLLLKDNNYIVFGSLSAPNKRRNYHIVYLATNWGANISNDCGPTRGVNNTFQGKIVEETQKVLSGETR